MKKLLNLFTFLYFYVALCDSEYSTKWDVKTKSIKIGGEVILNCNLNACPSGMKKAWYGGNPYNLLCYDNMSTNALKYEMILHNNTFQYDLTIKKFNFFDINCEYTCACGFNQDTKMLRLHDLDSVYGDIIDSSKPEYDKYVVAVEMKVYPIPICYISYKTNIYDPLVTIIGYVTSGPYIITINKSLDMIECKGSIPLTCQIGSSDYLVKDLYFNTCEDDAVSESPSISLILGIAGGLTFLVLVLSILGTYKIQRTKFCDICKH